MRPDAIGTAQRAQDHARLWYAPWWSMKRLTRGAREHFARRAKYEAKRRREAARFPVLRRAPLRVFKLELSGYLDLIDNAEETRAQLEELDRIVAKSRHGRLRLIVDLSKVIYLDPCALLYVAAQFDTLGVRRCRVGGNYPIHEPARRALRDARFERFMGSPERLGVSPSADQNIELHRGNRALGVRPRDWAPLHRFIKEHGSLTDEEAEVFYAAFGECMENVVQHAYKGRARGRWYALATRSTDQPARAVVLDLGVGIARSIRRKSGDVLRMFAGHIAKSVRAAMKRAGFDLEDDQDVDEFLHVLESFDWFCVHLATMGKRTETGEAKRGKGLSDLRRAVLEHQRGALRLHVLSGHATVTWARGSEPPVTNLRHLRGTIVCLELGATKEERDGT